jgi:hypothetical protein
MHSSLHSILAAQLIQDRMAETTSPSAARQEKRARWLDPEPGSARRWLTRSRSTRSALASTLPR